MPAEGCRVAVSCFAIEIGALDRDSADCASGKLATRARKCQCLVDKTILPFRRTSGSRLVFAASRA